MGKKQKKPGKGKEKTERRTAKGEEKRARREARKIGEEDDIDAILVSNPSTQLARLLLPCSPLLPQPKSPSLAGCLRLIDLSLKHVRS
jgi:hypothetical protein